jgi:cell division initiation protein
MFDPALSPGRSPADTSQQPPDDLEAREHSVPAITGRDGAGGPSANAPQGTHMNVSPLDLRQQRFRTAFRGFDPIEVTAFLAAVADDYEQALREADRLRQDLGKMEAVLNEHREHERNLRNTLLTAQKLADEIKEHADQEARRVIREAEGRADLLLEKAQLRLDDVQRDIDGLRLKRREVETSIEATILTLRNTLDYVRTRDERDAENKLATAPLSASSS